MSDVDAIAPFLYQGAAPPASERLRVDLLILCAEEYQPEPHAFPSVTHVHYAPNDDNSARKPTRKEVQIACRAAALAAARVRDRQTVLVTCMAGLNRSGLVTALALHLLTGNAGFVCVNLVRKARAGSLFNEQFVRLLESLPYRAADARTASALTRDLERTLRHGT